MTTATASAPLGFGTAERSRERRRFDPFGLVSGFRAYRIYTNLDAKSDAELTAMGLDRASLARVAIDAA